MRQGALSRCVAALAVAAFVWTLVLSVSPELHERIHANQSRADHSCAVTVLRSGSCHHAAVPLVGSGSHPIAEFATVPELTSCWVASPFLSAAIFEHAPPVLS